MSAHELSPPTFTLSTASGFIPDDLICNGVNRSTRRAQIDADNDIQAIREWLAEYSGVTLRSYTKEITRFFQWCVVKRRKSISGIDRTDIRLYEQFMDAPDEDWCSPRHHKRADGLRKPFEGPLNAKSKNYALIVIGSCLQWLVDADYLVANPMKVRKRTSSTVTKKQQTVEPPHIPLPTLLRAVAALERLADTTPMAAKRPRFSAERMLWTVRLLSNCGLRRSEAARAIRSDRMARLDPQTNETDWFLYVIGKGNKERYVAFNEAARQAYERFESVLKALGHQSVQDANAPLILPIGGFKTKSKSDTKPVSHGTVYNIVQDALLVSANELANEWPEDAALLRQATPHWFRHTFATISLGMGNDLRLVQQQLGHESIETTAAYSHPELRLMYAAFNKLSI